MDSAASSQSSSSDETNTDNRLTSGFRQLGIDHQTRARKDLNIELNKCTISEGKELLESWIQKPTMDIQVVKNRQYLVNYFIKNRQMITAVRNDHLRGFKILFDLILSIQQDKADAHEVVVLCKIVPQLADLVRCLRDSRIPTADRKHLNAAFTKHLQPSLDILEVYRNLVSVHLDLENASWSEKTISVIPNSNVNLYRAHNAVEDVRKKMHKLAVDIGKLLKLSESGTIELVESPNFESCLEVDKNSAQLVRDAAGTNHYDILYDPKDDDQSDEEGLFFSCPELRVLWTALEEANADHHKLAEEVITSLVKELPSCMSALCSLAKILGHLDVVVNLASNHNDRDTKDMPYIRPQVSTASGLVKLKGARNPLAYADEDDKVPMEMTMSLSSRKLVVDGQTHDEQSPYMAVFTTIITMATLGCLVPCESAEICLSDGLFPDPNGNKDSIVHKKH